jgi:hypothetical protein
MIVWGAIEKTHLTDTGWAYPWFGFDRAHDLRDVVEESQLDEEMTLGILLERYAFACRKRPAAPETLDRFSDPPTRSTEQRDVVNVSR